MRRKICSTCMALYVALMCGSAAAREVPAAARICEGKEKDDALSEASGHSPRYSLPPNLYLVADLRPVLLDLLRMSPTFRKQCLRIGAAVNVRVTIRLTPLLTQCRCRALSRVTRFTGGFVIVEMQLLAARSDLIELIGHEFEHVLEQLEGIDLGEMSMAKGSSVYRLGDGSFETVRAIKAGRVVAGEYTSSQRAATAR